MTPSGEAARPGRHQQSGTALRAGLGIAVRRATQTVTGHVDDAERYRQPEVEPACADLGKWLRTWRHRLVCGAIRGCLAQQVAYGAFNQPRVISVSIMFRCNVVSPRAVMLAHDPALLFEAAYSPVAILCIPRGALG